MAQLLVYLPDDLAKRFKQAVPARQRSQFVQRLIQDALPDETDDPIYRAALAVEQDEAFNDEMAEIERATVGDGLERLP